MSNSSMQVMVKEFVEKYGLQTDARSRFIDLVSEIGELGKEILTCTDYGKKKLETNKHISGEMGDCLFSLFALCDVLGISAEDALDMALRKYTERFESKGHVGSNIEEAIDAQVL